MKIQKSFRGNSFDFQIHFYFLSMRKKISAFFSTVSIVILFSTTCSVAHAQLTTYSINTPRCKRATYVKPYLHFPPLQSDMPHDVMIGYSVIDSLVRHADYFDTYRCAIQMPQDSLLLLLKYYNKVGSYDPLLFEVYSMDLNNIAHKMRPEASV